MREASVDFTRVATGIVRRRLPLDVTLLAESVHVRPRAGPFVVLWLFDVVSILLLGAHREPPFQNNLLQAGCLESPGETVVTWLDAVRTRIAGWFWGRAARAGGIPTWMAERVVRERINERVSGEKGVWPTDWLRSRVNVPAGAGLSLGCGEGALERDLIEKKICRTVLGLDASKVAIELASERAEEKGFEAIRYEVADLNRLDLGERRFDAAFFHQSLHHVSDLDRCLAEVCRSIGDAGWLYLDEYVGPSRRDWNRSLIADAVSVWETLPAEIKVRRKIGYPIDRRDPTEAIRSGEILRVLARHFEIFERRDYGGNLLALIHPNLTLGALDEVERNTILEALLDIEDELLERGVPSYYTVLLARPR